MCNTFLISELPGSPLSTSLRLDDVTDAELPSGVSRSELDTLKRDAVHCLNESLFKKLREIEQVKWSSVFARHGGEEKCINKPMIVLQHLIFRNELRYIRFELFCWLLRTYFHFLDSKINFKCTKKRFSCVHFETRTEALSDRSKWIIHFIFCSLKHSICCYVSVLHKTAQPLRLHGGTRSTNQKAAHSPYCYIMNIFFKKAREKDIGWIFAIVYRHLRGSRLSILEKPSGGNIF